MLKASVQEWSLFCMLNPVKAVLFQLGDKCKQILTMQLDPVAAEDDVD